MSMNTWSNALCAWFQSKMYVTYSEEYFACGESLQKQVLRIALLRPSSLPLDCLAVSVVCLELNSHVLRTQPHHASSLGTLHFILEGTKAFWIWHLTCSREPFLLKHTSICCKQSKKGSNDAPNLFSCVEALMTAFWITCRSILMCLLLRPWTCCWKYQK